MTTVSIVENNDLIDPIDLALLEHAIPRKIPYPRSLGGSGDSKPYVNIRYKVTSAGAVSFAYARHTTRLEHELIDNFRAYVRDHPDRIIVSYRNVDDRYYELFEWWKSPDADFVLTPSDDEPVQKDTPMSAIKIEVYDEPQDPAETWESSGVIPFTATITERLRGHADEAGHFFIVVDADVVITAKFTRPGADTSNYDRWRADKSHALIAFAKVTGEQDPVFKFDPLLSIAPQGVQFDLSEIGDRDAKDISIAKSTELVVIDNGFPAEVGVVWASQGHIPRFSIPPSQLHEGWGNEGAAGARMDNFTITLGFQSVNRVVRDFGWMDKHPHTYIRHPSENQGVVTLYYRRITPKRAGEHPANALFELDPRFSILSEGYTWTPEVMTIPTKLEREVEDVWSKLIDEGVGKQDDEQSPEVENYPLFKDADLENTDVFIYKDEDDAQYNYMFVDSDDHDYTHVVAHNAEDLIASSGWSSYWKRVYRRDLKNKNVWRLVHEDDRVFTAEYEFALRDGTRVPILSVPRSWRFHPDKELLHTHMAGVSAFLERQGKAPLYTSDWNSEDLKDRMVQWQRNGQFDRTVRAYKYWLLHSDTLQELRRLQDTESVPWKIVPAGSYVARDPDAIAASAEARWYDAPDDAQRCPHCNGMGGWYESMTYIVCHNCDGKGVIAA